MMPGTYKVIPSKEFSKCWYCKSETNGVLTFSSGDEIWCCESCAWKHGKVKRFRKRYKTIDSTKQTKINDIPFVDSAKIETLDAPIIPQESQGVLQ